MSLTFTDEDITLAVKKGVYWLDKNHPNWVNRIDLQELDMNDCDACIIGQAIGDYYATIARVVDCWVGQNYWAMEHGFCAPSFYNEDGEFDLLTEHNYYAGLETVWSEEVRKRLS